MRLRDVEAWRTPWRDAYVVLRHAPMGSPIAGAVEPAFEWTIGEHMTTNLVELLQGLIWCFGDGKADKPEPIMRPGRSRGDSKSVQVMGTTPMSIAEVDADVAAWRRGATE